MKREQQDDALWAMLLARPPLPGPPPAPRNFPELAAMAADHSDWEAAWSAFTHNVFAYKLPSFFDQPPPATLPVERQAQCAGAAEALCIRFGWPVPEWTHKPEYTLEEPWCPESMLSGLPYEELAPRCSPALLSRNVLMADRDLIAI